MMQKESFPAGACDCHMHIYDTRFPPKPGGKLLARPAMVADYRRIQARLGLERVVVVQSSAYATDNRCALAAMAEFGARARGVAVVGPAVSAAELAALTAAGMRGLRYLMYPGGALTWETLPAMAARVAPFGWHINLQLPGEDLVARAHTLAALPCDLMIDHIGRFTAPVDNNSPGVRALHRLLDAGRCWVKLSAPYHGSKSGPPSYDDIGALARELVRRWPQRMVWASNWPHPSVKGTPPDDLDLSQLLWDWAPDATTRQSILVDNPAQLYGFG